MDGNPLFRPGQPRCWLRTVSAILEQDVHGDGWSRAQAMHLIHDAFQRACEAEGKRARAIDRRAAADCCAGVQEQVDLLQAMEARPGGGFGATAHYAQMLPWSAPRIRYVGERMLAESIR